MRNNFSSIQYGLCCLLVCGPWHSGRAATNVPPTPVVLSAAQRPGTTYMDIDFRVDDPDDATLQVAALGFVNGGSSSANILKISTLAEGTETNLGANIPASPSYELQITSSEGAFRRFAVLTGSCRGVPVVVQ